MNTTVDKNAWIKVDSWKKERVNRGSQMFMFYQPRRKAQWRKIMFEDVFWV